MKLSELTVKKGYIKRLTIKGASGSYKSDENSAEAIMTFKADNNEIDVKKANELVRETAQDLLDDDASWIKNPEEVTGKVSEVNKTSKK